MTPSSQRLVVGGTALETRWVGPRPGEAPTVVLLHEGLGSVALWRDFPERLAAATGCGVFLYSRAGYGASDPVVVPRPLTYMHDEGLEVLPKVLDAIGFEKGILLGHSDGASIAAIYAGAVPDDRVLGLVLIAPHFFVEPISIASIAEAKVAYETGTLRERLARYHGDNVDLAFWGWNRAWLDPEFEKWDIREYLPSIRVPMLVVHGSDDPYGTIKQAEAAQAESHVEVEVAVIPGARHAAHLERPEPTLAAISEFVRQQSSRTTD
ncbi:MAG: alpha/beta fold hydrolase [Gemmatimonadales bacterium]